MLLDSEDLDLEAVPTSGPVPASNPAAATASLIAQEQGTLRDASAPAAPTGALHAEEGGNLSDPGTAKLRLELAAGKAGAVAVDQADVQTGSQGAALLETGPSIEPGQAQPQSTAEPGVGQPGAPNQAADTGLEMAAGAAPEEAPSGAWHVRKRRPPPDAPPQQATPSEGADSAKLIPHHLF